MPVERHIQRMMQDLGTALAQEIAGTSKVGEVVRRIRREGYSLYLVLGNAEEGNPTTQIEIGRRKNTQPPPAFRLDNEDVSLLKSLGIDGTRSARRRRGA